MKPQSQTDLTEVLCSKGHSIFKIDCRSCGALKKDWYQNLSHSGFEDIESNIRLFSHHVTHDIQIASAGNQIVFEAKRDYYAWAERCLTTSSFDSMIEKLTWEYYAEGYTHLEIAKSLSCERSTVTKRVKKLETWLRAR